MTRLLDTNHVIAYLNGDPSVRARVEAERGREDDFALTTTVLGELYYGAHASERVAENLAKLSTLRQRFLVLDFDAAAAEEFGRIRAEQRGKGRPVPAIDVQIAAVARLTGATLVTNDAHFDELDGLSLQGNRMKPDEPLYREVDGALVAEFAKNSDAGGAKGPNSWRIRLQRSQIAASCDCPGYPSRTG